MNAIQHKHEFLSERLLCAQFNRVKNERTDDCATARFQYTKREIHGGSLLFSGAFFLDDWTRAVLPFAIVFRPIDGYLIAGSATFATSVYSNVRGRTFAFFAVVDHAERCGFIPHGSFERQKEIVTRNSRHPERLFAVSEYAAFRERSAKDLEYDLSLSVLEMLEQPSIERAPIKLHRQGPLARNGRATEEVSGVAC